MLDAIRIVLVEPTHPGNIGAAARAMKTMGLSRMHLVNPKFFPSAEATARAAGADDILFDARVHDDFVSAIARCGWVVGTSARPRRLPVEEFSPRQCAAGLLEKVGQSDVALVFGRESSGLTNHEIERCHGMVTIPTDPAFASLNIASAVQVLGYEIRCQLFSSPVAKRSARAPAPVDDMERFFSSLEQTLIEIGYLDPQAPKHLMRRLRRLFGRSNPDAVELNILMGILAAARDAAERRFRAMAESESE
ncbi:MAG TPA: RNA methyltransferase [Gammaproteobacteria bacterium]|nr:RNA methyltransferase [Gammaproteobacteria bacterium]